MEYAAAALIGLALGAVAFAPLVARRHGVDVRSVGDGNPGAWNALSALGWRRAWPVFAGDALKATAAALAGLALAGWWGAYAGVAGAMAGHALRGGKSVMAFVGGGLVLVPGAWAIAVAVCGAVTAARSFAWGARAGVAAFPAITLAFVPAGRVAAIGALMTGIGLLFLRGRTSGRARSAAGGPPRA